MDRKKKPLIPFQLFPCSPKKSRDFRFFRINNDGSDGASGGVEKVLQVVDDALGGRRRSRCRLEEVKKGIPVRKWIILFLRKTR